MNTRKSNNQVQPIGIFHNRTNKNPVGLWDIDYGLWFKKTFIKLIICLTILLVIIIIKNINTRATNYIITKVDYRINKQFNLVDNYHWAKDSALQLIRKSDDIIPVFNFGGTSQTQFVSPMKGEIISFFEEEVEGRTVKTRGIVIQGEIGDEVIATQEGVVLEIGENQSSGNYIIIKHKGELLSVYKNLDQRIVSKNQKVVIGEIIGTSAGKLRFEVWQNKQPVDPLLFINLGIQSM
ncbi:murein hydrolase activator EnvC family protein [Natronincola ferrireducens]|uniref:Peptidase family M23 n=1 Tax=Natronincola ferrireducens TaxID=393762 RepID=A0A1G9D1X0_9FIRM|nr:M23 family metallopeptidase [Natronincola ferrireducens]SDK57922.1 Peptidase family M23 [Natronincola ferrireducens]